MFPPVPAEHMLDHLTLCIKPVGAGSDTRYRPTLYRLARKRDEHGVQTGWIWEVAGAMEARRSRYEATASIRSWSQAIDVPHTVLGTVETQQSTSREVSMVAIPRSVMDATRRRREVRAQLSPEDRRRQTEASAYVCRRCEVHEATLLVPNLDSQSIPIWQPCCKTCSDDWTDWMPPAVYGLPFAPLIERPPCFDSLPVTTEATDDDLFTLTVDLEPKV